jgi:predicted double-glycine peptidase
MNFRTQLQKTEYTCGAAAVINVLSYLKYPTTFTEEYLASIGGISPIYGCTHDSMEHILNSVGLENERIVGKDKHYSFEKLNNELSEGHLCIMRTLTRGIKHWIVVYRKEGEKYRVSDSWLGDITYTKKQIDSIWRPRDYDAFFVK